MSSTLFLCSCCCLLSDIHMYMGQPPVYTPSPAEVQAYQNQASLPGPPPGPSPGPGAMNQPPSYSASSGQSLQAPTDTQHIPYPEKALL